MDKKAFVKEIKDIFIDYNAREKKYSKIWLTEENFGGLYRSGKYNINLKPFHNFVRIGREIDRLVDMLHDKLGPEKRDYYFSLDIHDESEETYDERGDIVLLNEESVA